MRAISIAFLVILSGCYSSVEANNPSPDAGADGDAEVPLDCEDSCDEDGTRQCSGTSIEVCALGDNGCLEWREELDCWDEESLCTVESGEPTCVACRETTCEGDFVIETEADFDAVEGCTRISGMLTIRGPEVTNVDRLRCLISVSVLFIGDEAVEPEEEPENAIESLEGLASLETASTVWIMNVPNLTSVEGLRGLHSISEMLQIENTPSLRSLDGFRNLEAVEHGVIMIHGPSALEEIDGFDRLLRTPTLRIGFHDNLREISGFQSLESVGDIRITNNENLSRLSGFDSVEDVAALAININASLHSIDGFASLSTCASVGLSSNESLTRVDANLCVGGLRRLTLRRNPLLRSFECPVTEIPEGLHLGENSGEYLRFFHDLVSVGALVIIEDGDLTTLEGLESLERAESLTLERLNSLTSLAALSSLQSVEGELALSYNGNLTDFQGLEALVSVGSLNLFDNDRLEHLDGIDSLTVVDDLSIIGNGALPTCEAENFLERLIADGFTGHSNIVANDHEGVCFEP